MHMHMHTQTHSHSCALVCADMHMHTRARTHTLSLSACMHAYEYSHQQIFLRDHKPLLSLQINGFESDTTMAHFQSVTSLQGTVHISSSCGSAKFCLLLTVSLGNIYSHTSWVCKNCHCEQYLAVV
jgi:hypothetical protein